MIRGFFRSFTNVNKDGKANCSIVMTVDKSNEELLMNLGSRIRELVLSKTNKLSAFMQTPRGMFKLSNIRKDDVVLVKFSEKGYENVNMKVYASNAIRNPMNCKFRRDVEVNGMVSGESIHWEDGRNFVYRDLRLRASELLCWVSENHLNSSKRTSSWRIGRRHELRRWARVIMKLQAS